MTYLVICAGAVVRMTGSGMGCPDWPQCFGQYIPPTDVSQLPGNYQELYSHRGYDSMEFNAAKTWTEYINRLTGATMGLFVLALAIGAFLRKPRNGWLTGLSVLLVFLTGFQAWLGKVVVDSILAPVMITIHMVAAMVIVALLIVVIVLAQDKPAKAFRYDALTFYLLISFTLLTLIQIALGTQVREAVDTIAATLDYQQRDSWIAQLGSSFIIHRSFAWLVLINTAALIYLNFKRQLHFKYIYWMAALVLVEILIGIVLSYLAVPPLSQAMHLVVAAILFGVQFYVLLIFRRSTSLV